MKIYDVEQGSDQWFELRKGIPTCSRFSQIVTGTGKLSSQADDLICELVSEKHSLIPPEGVENYTNRAMRWGEQTEHDACRWYEMETGSIVRKVGFITTDDGRFGGSPDRVVEPFDSFVIVGGAEVKCPQGPQHCRYILDGIVPLKYRPQVHGYLAITGAAWWDFVSFSPGLSGLRIRQEPDDYTKRLKDALEDFHKRYLLLEEKILNGEPLESVKK